MSLRQTVLADSPSIERALYAQQYGVELGRDNGASRRCFWDGTSKWAYKFIITDKECNNPKANLEEWKHYQQLRNKDLGELKVPEMQMLSNGVLAIEYINGNHPYDDCWVGYHECGDIPECWYNRINGRYLARNFDGLHDIGPLNILITGANDIYVIDLEY